MADVNFNPALLNPNLTLASQILGQQEGQAGIAQTQAATQGQQLANQKAAFQNQFLPMLAKAYQQYAAGEQTSPQQQQAQDQSGVDEAPTLPGGEIDKAHVEGMIQPRFQQKPYVPSQQAIGLSMLANNAGMKDMGDGILAMDKAKYERDQQARQVGANSLLNQVYGLQDAVKGGTGIAALRDIDGGAAESLEAKAKANNWSDADLNRHVGEWADAVGGAVFRHTGREISDNNGTPYDKQAGRPVPGGAQAPLSAQQYQAAIAEWSKPVTVGKELPKPLYKTLGYPTAGAAIQANPNGPPGQEAAPAASQGAPAQASAAPNATPTAQPGASPAAPNAAPAAPSGPMPGGVKPEAFADDSFKTPALPKVTDQITLKKSLDQQAINQKNTNDFKASINANAGIANLTKPYLDLAEHYLESGGVISGWGAEEKLQLSKLAASAGVPVAWLGDPSKTEAVIKDLGKASLQGARATYGSRMSTNEVNLQMTKLTPNTHQQPEAMLALIKQAKADAQYDLDTAALAPRYLAHGYDPQNFESWQNTYHNRSQFIQAQTEGSGKGGVASTFHVATPADYAKVPKGANYTLPNGEVRTKG